MKRSNKNGVSRVIMAYWLDNIDAAVRKFIDVLGIEDMEGPEDLPVVGLRVAISWDTGIEIISPMKEGGYSEQIRQYIDAHGEGMFGVVYEVGNLEEAEHRAAEHGHPSLARLDPFKVKPIWSERFSYLMESPLPAVAGVEMTLIQIVERTRPC